MNVYKDFALAFDFARHLEFSIEDTGVGVSPLKAKEIFNAFSQEDVSVTRKFGGSGLGLAISQNLVKLMKGEIKVKPRETQGSCFYFRRSTI